MARSPNNSTSTELTVIAVIAIIMLFLSPLTDYWADLNAPWYSPYLVWCIAIVISWLLQRYLNKHEI